MEEKTITTNEELGKIKDSLIASGNFTPFAKRFVGSLRVLAYRLEKNGRSLILSDKQSALLTSLMMGENKPIKKLSSKEEIYQQTIDEANKAGREAVKNCELTMVQAVEHVNPLDDSSPVKRVYEPFPICGFAWIVVKPGTSAFARWLKSKDQGWKKHYYGGISLWVSDFGQSYDKKLTYANAYADVINEAAKKYPKLFKDMGCYASGRLD